MRKWAWKDRHFGYAMRSYHHDIIINVGFIIFMAWLLFFMLLIGILAHNTIIFLFALVVSIIPITYILLCCLDIGKTERIYANNSQFTVCDGWTLFVARLFGQVDEKER